VTLAEAAPEPGQLENHMTPQRYFQIKRFIFKRLTKSTEGAGKNVSSKNLAQKITSGFQKEVVLRFMEISIHIFFKPFLL